MKKLALILFALISISITAQKKEKIKGNREVLIKKFELPHFNEIEVGEKLEIGLQKAVDTTRVIIETDDNLFDVIKFSVENGVLHFYTTMEIVKKKRLRITVFVPEDFDKISLIEKGKVYNEERLRLENLRIEATRKSKAELNLNINEILEIEASGKAELKVEAFVKDVYIRLTENASLEAKLEAKNADLNLDDHSYCKLQGNVDYMKVDMQVKAKLRASELQSKEAVLTLKDKASAEVNNTGDLELKLSGQSQTYIFGSPKINLKVFKDNAALYKK